jgi:hypothetical protein
MALWVLIPPETRSLKEMDVTGVAVQLRDTYTCQGHHITKSSSSAQTHGAEAVPVRREDRSHVTGGAPTSAGRRFDQQLDLGLGQILTRPVLGIA